jgi:hypothetical protein
VVEHFLGKEEVKGSIPFNGSGIKARNVKFELPFEFPAESKKN